MPAVSCWLSAFELGLALAYAAPTLGHPALPADVLEALVTYGVVPLPFECEHRHLDRAGVLRHRRLQQVVGALTHPEILP